MERVYTPNAPVVYRGTLQEGYQLCCKGCCKLIKSGDEYIQVVGHGYHCPSCASRRFGPLTA